MKKTPLLKAVIAILEKTSRPLSVPELQDILACRGLRPHKTTLYRMLAKLGELGRVEALLLDPNVVYYELKTHHHHHFRCESCEVIECVSDPVLEKHIHALEKNLIKRGLKVEQHHFSLSGTCATCH